MNVDELRRALHQPPAVPLAVEVTEVLRRGRRRRLARRVALPAAAAAVVLTVGIPAVLTGTGGGTGPAAARGRGVEPTSPPWSSHPPTPGPGECRALSGAELDTRPPCGAVIGTGTSDKAGERVFWFSGLDRPGYLYLQEGRRQPDGRTFALTSVPVDAATFSTVAPVDLGVAAARGAYGAVRGDVRRVVLAAGGRTVEARVVAWSVEPALSLWWTADGRLGRLVGPGDTGVVATAYDPRGTVLATVRLTGG